MDFAFAVVIYFVVWWISLFLVLPLWVKPQIEEENMVPGTATSAPVAPMMLKKFIVTTLLSATIFLTFYLLSSYELISLDSIPFLPRFDGHYS